MEKTLLKVNRSDKLLNDLSSEKERWNNQIGGF